MIENQKSYSQYIVVKVGEEEIGIELSHVLGFINTPDSNRITEGADYMEGIFEQRGEAVPIIDLRKLLGGRYPADDSCSTVIIVESGEGSFGLVVDCFCEILSLTEGELESVEQKLREDEVQYIEQVGIRNGRLLLIIDLEKMAPSRKVTAGTKKMTAVKRKTG